MHVNIVQNATRMPTDGYGASAAERENGNLTAVTQLSATCSGGAATAVAGDLILSSQGFWAEVTGAAVAGVLPVKEWKKWGVSPHFGNTGRVDPMPAASGTYRIFPASVLQAYRQGSKLLRVNIEVGVVGSTLTINGPDGAALVTLNSVVTTPVPHEFDSLFVRGPFTVVCSNHAVVGHLEFEPFSA